MRVSAGNDQSEQRKTQIAISLLPLFEQNGMNVAFEMIDGNQRFFQRERQRLGVADSDEQALRQGRGPE